MPAEGPRRGERSPRRRALVLLVVGATAVLFGAVLSTWASSRPVGRDPYTTFLDAEPTRDGYLTALIAAGLVLGAAGLVVMVTGLVASLRSRRR